MTFIENEQARCECFKLLAACFYQPQKEVLLEEKALENLSGLLGRVCPDAAASAAHMKDALLKYSNDELLVEYAKLFVGPFELKAAPYGSVYLDEGRKVMGESTVKVMEIYKEEGLVMDGDFKDLPDHITVELEFMYYLAFKEVEALEEKNAEKAAYYLDARESFQRNFPGKWISPFCNKIKEGTDNEFYNALADCLAAFMKSSNGTSVPDRFELGSVRM